MPITERVESVEGALRWKDSIPLHYEYTAGVAGEKALRALMKGSILAGRCDVCEETSLPPRIYCVNCYSPINKFVKVGTLGKVRALTQRPAEDGRSFVFVSFEGVRGGLVHHLIGRARVGDRVRPRFRAKAKRKGSIDDLLGFERDRSR